MEAISVLIAACFVVGGIVAALDLITKFFEKEL